MHLHIYFVVYLKSTKVERIKILRNRDLTQGQVVDVSSFEDFLNLMETSRSERKFPKFGT